MIRYLPFFFLFCWGNAFAQGNDLSFIRPFVKNGPGVEAGKDFSRNGGAGINQAYAVKGHPPAGTHILRRLSDSLWIVSINNDQVGKECANKLRIIAPVNNLWKLSPVLLEQINPSAKNLRIITQWLLGVKEVTAFQQRYPASSGVKILQQYTTTGTLLVSTPSNWLQSAVWDDPNILFIAGSRMAKTERELTGFDLSANRVNLAHRTWPETNGNGLGISIKENRMDTADIDIRGRYLYSPKASASMQTHATTMATIAAGGGNTYYTGKGVAWGANVSSSDFANLLPDNIQNLQSLGVSVQNHSYGVGIENYYGADAAAYDAQLYDNPQLLHIFSSGNAGNQSAGTGKYAGITGYANLSGSFKMAKNILTVGATDSFARVAVLSSKGPAYDGRIKPELVALGEDGSSGAAAIVSGMAILVQDAWKQANAALPSSSVVRSILLNSAEDTGPAGPDYSSGFGTANAWRALQTVKERRVFQGSVSNGETKSHTITLPASTAHLKITINWTDPPAQANSFQALVNDLDLVLVSPTGTQQWLPWVLNSSPSPDSLQKLPVRKRDSLNTAEQITLDLPQPGQYQVLVKGYSVTGKAQEYAIAWQYDTLAHFMFTYPVKGDNLFPLQTHTLRWETSLSGNGSFDYRINTGQWRSLGTGMTLSQNWASFPAPDSIGAIQFRMSNGGRQWYSDTVSLSPNLLVRTGLNCVDSFLIYWQRAGVTSYRVYRLGNRYLEPFTLVSDTSLLQSKQNNPYRYFTLAPVLPFQMEGNKSYTFDYTQQQVDCYLNGFNADPAPNEMARLQLQLGTTYRVARIVFEKKKEIGYDSLKSISPVTSLQNNVLVPATNGLNTYRARIILQDGRVFLTKPEQVYQFGAQSYYVFPNPVQPGKTLQLLAEDPDDTVFQLYDAGGRKIFEYRIDSYLSTLPLPLLQRGTYFYRLVKAGMQALTHKLLVL